MVILGAGLAGLSAAYHTGGVIYEREQEIGGTCRSLQEEGYVFDCGIHVLHTKNDYVLKLLSKYKKLGLEYKKRSAWIHSHNVLTKYPFQANTFGLPKDIANQCVAGFMDTLGKTKQGYDNYEEWVYATFGKGIADHFYLPYSEKFWTVKAKELTCDWLGIRVPRPRLEQVIRGALSIQKEEFGPNVLFQYPKRGGIQRVAKALLKKNMKVIFGKEASRIKADKKVIHFSDQSFVNYDNLISTIPLPELISMIDEVPGSVREASEGLRHNSILCVNLGVRQEKLNSSHWIYFPEEQFCAFRISFPRNFSRFTVPGKWSSIQAEIAYSESKPIKYRDIVEKVIRDLIKAKIIKAKDKIKLVNTRDIKYAYVIHDHSRINNLKIINKFLRRNNIYNAGRYGQWEYLWMDEAILSGKKAAEEIT
ncbi:MAG: FAD-dependent oxidoreductase [Candidatus Omnitrophica bacterium]|nr:FAD-dependent oxidoreductase [Candidatus Omnitrophota bacterium]